MIQMPVDPELHKAACKIAVRCRNVIQSCLRDEEIADCDLAFFEVAMEIMRELHAFKNGGEVMPTREQMQAALDRVKVMEKSGFTRDGNTLIPSPAGVLTWNDLSEGEKLEQLGGLRWDGFEPDEAMEVMANVADGLDDPMDGVEPEMTSEELDAMYREWRDDASQRPLAEKGVDYSDRPYGEAGEAAPERPSIDDRIAMREAKARDLFDTSNRLMFAGYLRENSANPDIAMRPAERVREAYFEAAEETWPGFRQELMFREDAEIDATLVDFRAREAALETPMTLMDRLREGGLFLNPALDPYSAAAAAVPEPIADGHPIRPLTRQLIECCELDAWPGNAAVIDFGIDSSSHLGALQFAIREGLVTPRELDDAMGSGEKLTEIAGRGDNPYRDVIFKTSWDGMPAESESTPEGDPGVLLTAERGGQGAPTGTDYEATLKRAYEQAQHRTREPDKGRDR